MKRMSLSVACAAALAFAGHADDINVTSVSFAFRLDTTGPTYAVGSASEASSLSPVTWRKGETVTVVSPAGGETTLVEDAASAGSANVSLDCGGLWHFTNTGNGSATIGVAWSVFGDGGELATSGGQTGLLDTAKPGPDRRIKSRQAMPIAYSGDDWLARDPSAASTLTIAPANAGAPTEYSMTGTGAQPFTFSGANLWTVVLAPANGPARTATISLAGGLVVSFR